MKTIETQKGLLAVLEDDTLIIDNPGSFLNALVSSGADIVAFSKENFSSAFFDLKTRLAGECLQKVSNHRMKLIILGDFTDLPDGSLKDFITESNRSGQVVFSPDLGEAIRLLR